MRDRPLPAYTAAGWAIADWLATTDHKRGAWLYLFTPLDFFLLGGAAAS